MSTKPTAKQKTCDPSAGPPEGFKIYDGPRDWSFIPGAMFWAKHDSLWLQVNQGTELGACADPTIDIIVPIEPEPMAESAAARQEGGSHYKSLAIQPAEFITRNKLSFLEGCVVKRVCRHRAKNGAEDIRKAIHELQLILELEYGTK